MDKLKGIFFDFGNTIVDEKPFIHGAQMGVVRHVRDRLKLEQNEEQLYEKLKSTPQLPAGHPLRLQPKDREYSVRRKWIIDFAKACGMNDADSAADELMNAYDDGAKHSDCIIGSAGETLRKLSENFKLCIVSNGYAGFVHATLDYHDFKRYFQRVLVSQEVNIEKPDPAIYAMALTGCGLKPGEAMMVGDSYKADVEGARAAGLMSCWVNPGGIEPPGDKHDLIVRDIDELPGRLSEWEKDGEISC